MRLAIIGGEPDYLVRFRGALIEAAARAGHEVMACAQADAARNDRIASALAEKGAVYEPIPLDRHGTSPSGELRTLRALRSALRRFRPDVVLCYTAKMLTLGTLAAKSSRRPPTVHAMVTGVGSALTEGERSTRAKVVHAAVAKLMALSLRLADQVIFQNPDDRDYLGARRILPPGKRTALVAGSGVDIEEFSLVPLPEPPLVLLQVGRVHRFKGVSEFVEAARRVKRDHPTVRFRLVGPLETGPGGGYSEAEVRGWVDEGFLEWPGSSDDVREELRRCSVFVLPSYREGTPRSVLEALATGRPVITADAPGCRETVVDGLNGFLVEARSSESVERAMRRLISEPLLLESMAGASRELAEQKYDVRLVNTALLELMGL